MLSLSRSAKTILCSVSKPSLFETMYCTVSALQTCSVRVTVNGECLFKPGSSASSQGTCVYELVHAYVRSYCRLLVGKVKTY